MSAILVVDDTQLHRECLAKLLQYEGFRTIKAKNGKEAWATLYQDKPDLILLDLMMPEMDGITFLSMLRASALWGDLPVVVLTAADDRDQLISKAWALGVSDLVPKAGYGFEDLLARIRHHLTAPRPPRAAAPQRPAPSNRPAGWRPTSPAGATRYRSIHHGDTEHTVKKREEAK